MKITSKIVGRMVRPAKMCIHKKSLKVPCKKCKVEIAALQK